MSYNGCCHRDSDGTVNWHLQGTISYITLLKCGSTHQLQVICNDSNVLINSMVMIEYALASGYHLVITLQEEYSLLTGSHTLQEQESLPTDPFYNHCLWENGFSRPLDRKFRLNLKILRDNHDKTIYEPDGTDCSSCKVGVVRIHGLNNWDR